MSLTIPRGGMPAVDFSTLGSLGEQYKTGRRQQIREQTLADLGRTQGPLDYAQATRALLAAGDTEGAMSLARLAESQATRALTQSNSDRTYQLARDQFTATVEGAKVPPGYQRTPTGLAPVPGGPQDPQVLEAAARAKRPPLAPADKKAVLEAEDEIPQVQGTIESLTRAKAINSKTMTGILAGPKAYIGSRVPGGSMLIDKEKADYTTEWQTIMGPEAIKNMASTLKGVTTDFELRKFEAQLADPTTPPEIRGKIIDRMILLAERKKAISEARVKDLRSGTYFNAQPTAQPAQPRPQTQVAPQVSDAHIAALKANPQRAKEFDEKFGPGTAELILGQQ